VRAAVVAVLPVRDGVPPLGGDEAVAEAGGAAVLVGSGVAAAVRLLSTVDTAWLAEVGDFAPGRWAAGLAAVLGEVAVVILPASPDGRDLAPRLAAALGRPLLAGAVRVSDRGADLVRWAGRVGVPAGVDGPFVATLLPGVRGTADAVLPPGTVPTLHELTLALGSGPECRVVEVLAADPATADLAEAPRVLAAGAGLLRGAADPAATVALLEAVAAALGASVGATRVVTDAGWIGYERQIGTTGAVVDPDLYVALGISGAAQHVGGLGRPRHVASVNTDPSCPMTALADLGIVADAPALLAELAARLDVAHAGGSGGTRHRTTVSRDNPRGAG
jgi:electron transfer flavoprotein alpha subunit